MQTIWLARMLPPFRVHIRLQCGAVNVFAVVGLMVWAVAACGQQIALEAEVTLGVDRMVDIQGTVTASNLHPQGQAKVSNTVEVYVEYIEAGGTFRSLPDSFWIQHGPTQNGELLSAEEQTGVKANKEKVFEQKLTTEDEAKAFAIASKDVKLPAEAVEFRIVAFLNHAWSGTWPAWAYRYSVLGPYEAVTAEVGPTAKDIMVDDSKTPPEWEVGVAGAIGIDNILSLMSIEARMDEQLVQSSALQAVRIAHNELMVGAIVVATAADAKEALQVLAGEETAAVGDEMIRLPATETGVYGLMRDNVVYLIAGENRAAATAVAEKLAGSALSVSGSTTPSTPREPASVPAPPVPSVPLAPTPAPAGAPTPPPNPTTPSTPPSTAPAVAVELAATSVVKEAVICTGIDENRQPTGVTDSFPPQTGRVCLYLRIADAPADTMIRLEWSRNGELLRGFTIVVAGDHSAIVDVGPNRGEHLEAGQYAVDLKENGEAIGRVVFRIE
jgi:hypothetical protein